MAANPRRYPRRSAQEPQPALANHQATVQAAQAALANVRGGLATAQNGVQAFEAQLPTLFPAVALQNIENRLDQMVERMDGMVERMDGMVNRMDRMEARVANSVYDHALNDPITWLPSAQGAAVLPVDPEVTWADIEKLELDELRPYMLAYGLGVQGDKSVQLHRLRRYIGLRLAM